MTEQKRCECPETGNVQPGRAAEYDSVFEWPYVNHAPGQCECTHDLATYLRRGKEIMLCSCCYMLGDQRISQ